MSKLQEIVDCADQVYNKGCNCSEAIVTAFSYNYPEQIPEIIIPMSSNFGGGIGSGCICGAMAGGTMVIGALAGRKTPACKSKDELNAISKEYMSKLQEVFVDPCCKEIKESALGATGEYKNCTRVVRKVTEILAVFLADKGLIKI